MDGHIAACILAGGAGTRLFPLTAHRAKAAVRFGGSYRLIDFPLSNCRNSDIRQILIFPQYKPDSLERHLQRRWRLSDALQAEWRLSLRPPQEARGGGYRGTADAVYCNLAALDDMDPAHVLILAADHVYQMDYRQLLQFHQDCQADVTVATFAIPRGQASQFGIITVDQGWRVRSFLEKPTQMDAFPLAHTSLQASMGIYVFSFPVLRAVLQEDAGQLASHDFGHDILPGMVGRYRMAAFPFVETIGHQPAYWRDVGTLDAYWEAHMDLLGPHPRIDLQQPAWPLCPETRGGPSRIVVISPGGRSTWAGTITNCVISQSCRLEGSHVEASVLSPGVWIEPGAEVYESVLGDGVHIGRGAKVRRAVLDAGTVVPPGARIGYDRAVDGERFTVSEGGITVVGYMPAMEATHMPPMLS